MLDREGASFGSGYAGVPLIRPHDVRHTYATVSLDLGIDPKIVSDRIGHANSPLTTTRVLPVRRGQDPSSFAASP